MNKKMSILAVVLVIILVVSGCVAAGSAGVSNIRMTNNADGKNISTTFSPNDVIYAFFDVNQVADGAKFQAKWYALNVAGQDAATPFSVTDYSYNGESTIYAQIESNTGGFPAGQYKVEIYLDDVKAGEEQFSVQ